MLLLLGEETFCDTFISLKHQLSLERMLLVSSSFQMSQPEETGGCFQEVANTTNIRLAGVLQLGTFVGELERSHSFQYQPTPPNIHSPWAPVMPPSVCFHILPSDCSRGMLRRFPVLQVPCSAQAILLTAPAQAFECTFIFSRIL